MCEFRAHRNYEVTRVFATMGFEPETVGSQIQHATTGPPRHKSNFVSFDLRCRKTNRNKLRSGSIAGELAVRTRHRHLSRMPVDWSDTVLRAAFANDGSGRTAVTLTADCAQFNHPCHCQIFQLGILVWKDFASLQASTVTAAALDLSNSFRLSTNPQYPICRPFTGFGETGAVPPV